MLTEKSRCRSQCFKILMNRTESGRRQSLAAEPPYLQSRLFVSSDRSPSLRDVVGIQVLRQDDAQLVPQRLELF